MTGSFYLQGATHDDGPGAVSPGAVVVVRPGRREVGPGAVPGRVPPSGGREGGQAPEGMTRDSAPLP